MKERVYPSVRELFSRKAPDLLEFLDSEDSFWVQVRENTITDRELEGHQALLEELGMFDKNSAVAKAIQIIRASRDSDLHTPINFSF